MLQFNDVTCEGMPDQLCPLALNVVFKQAKLVVVMSDKIATLMKEEKFCLPREEGQVFKQRKPRCENLERCSLD